MKSLLSHQFLANINEDKINFNEREYSNVNKITAASVTTGNISIINSMEESSSDINQHSSIMSSQESGEIEKFNDYPKDSRLNTEFQVIGKVGSGAFGVVLKVKNRIDMCTYAIKRIRLNPNSDHLNKQITREIKLLSRLNHENVVRYYSTWMEKHEVDDNETDATEISTNTKEERDNNKKSPIKKKQNKAARKNSDKKLSNSFSSLLLKQSNMNMTEMVATNNKDDDDDFSSNLFEKVTTLSIPTSSSSSSPSSSSSDDSASGLDSSDNSSVVFDSYNSDDDNKNNNNNNHPVLFNISPSKKFEKELKNKNTKLFNKKKGNNNTKKKGVKDEDEDEDSIVFEKDGKSIESFDKKEDIEVDTSLKIEKHRVFVFIQVSFI